MIREIAIATIVLFSSVVCSADVCLPQQELTQLHQQGWSLLQPTLNGQQEVSLYTDDLSNLSAFPLDSYKVYEVDGQGKFYVDDVGDGIKEELKVNIPWEKSSQEIMKKYIKPNTVALDIGGHIGIHTIKMSECVGENGSVVVFEPSMKVYRELCMNLTLNGCKNVAPVRCALGSEAGLVKLTHPMPDNEGATFATKNAQGDVALRTVDAFHLQNISFIKIDAENMEGDILDGAAKTIAANKPVMLIEIQGNSVRANLLGEDMEKQKQEVIQKIEGMGYTVTYLFDRRAPNDYLAIPKE